MSAGFALKTPPEKDWQENRKMMDDAERFILKKRRLVRIYDVPYLAGYSRDGKEVYIDRQMPLGFVWRNRNIATDRYLIVHEATEKSLIDALGMPYLLAHQIAENAEEQAVKLDGIPDNVYDKFMNHWINIIGKRKQYLRCPPLLDMTPYHESHDQTTIARMQFARAA